MKYISVRLAAFFTAAAVFLCAFAPCAGLAEAPVAIGAERALLVDASTGSEIYGVKADEQTDVAGLVRLPALLRVCRAFDEGAIFDNSVVTVSRRAAGIRGATAFIAPDERISADRLLKAAVMLNAGDALCALIETLYPSPAAAAEAVSGELARLGISKDVGDALCAGVTFSPNELATVCRELAKSPSFLKYTSIYTDVLTHEAAADTELTNPNRLVRHYSGCYGLATGSVGSLNYCGAFIARRGGTALLAIVAGCSTSDARFSAGRELLDYGFSAFRTVQLRHAGEAIAVLPVTGGILESVSVIAGEDVSVLTPVSEASADVAVLLPEAVEAPVAEGQVLGELVITGSSGEELGRAPLAAAHGVDKARYGDYFGMLIEGWLGRGAG